MKSILIILINFFWIFSNVGHCSESVDLFDESYTSSICGKITAIRPLSEMEKKILNHGRCLVAQLLPAQTYLPEVVWKDLFRGTSSGQCHGLTVFGSVGRSHRVFLLAAFPRSPKNLLAYQQIGTTAFHEFNHYFTGSKDDDSKRDPKNIYDDPSLEAFRVALYQETPNDPGCVTETPGALPFPVKNRLQRLACDCGIQYWNSEPFLE